MASMTMDEFKCEEINFVLGWLQENGFERLKRVSEGKKNFVIPKLRHAVASNSYMGWGIWTPIFHNTWCIWTGITNICREFDLTKTSKSKFPGVCPGGGCQGFDLIRALHIVLHQLPSTIVSRDAETMWRQGWHIRQRALSNWYILRDVCKTSGVQLPLIMFSIISSVFWSKYVK